MKLIFLYKNKNSKAVCAIVRKLLGNFFYLFFLFYCWKSVIPLDEKSYVATPSRLTHVFLLLLPLVFKIDPKNNSFKWLFFWSVSPLLVVFEQRKIIYSTNDSHQFKQKMKKKMTMQNKLNSSRGCNFKILFHFFSISFKKEHLREEKKGVYHTECTCNKYFTAVK